MNKKIRKHLNDIEKTEKKIAELETYLKGVRAALKAEEDNEIIRCIRSRNLDSYALLSLLDGIQDESIQFCRREEPGQEAEEISQEKETPRDRDHADKAGKEQEHEKNDRNN